MYSCQGLSPRVRGNHQLVVADSHVVGSIPACAGEPSPVEYSPGHRSVYPRVCGGTHLGRMFQEVLEWSIPACAGEPTWHWPRSGCSRVYPRVCGGTVLQNFDGLYDRGLSPRVRGNRQTTASFCLPLRSIPACAGEPYPETSFFRGLPVYPRVCGGTVMLLVASSPTLGLSPRVRGNQQANRASVIGVGSIPACAGEPTKLAYSVSWERVYPRVCEGTSKASWGQTRIWGLSPRVRGNRWRQGRIAGHDGSIPACAGEPRFSPRIRGHGEVYPRVCGGTPNWVIPTIPVNVHRLA